MARRGPFPPPEVGRRVLSYSFVDTPSPHVNDIRWDRTAKGELTAWTHTKPSRVLLRQCADIVVERFGAEGRDRVEGMGQLFWDYVVGPLPITLHLDAQLGIAVLAGEVTEACEALVRQIAAYVADRTPPDTPP